ncbi:hypothetical protein MP228_003705 [Amoeboaphelidium protococcarum]|nr:hypothetical protein MP228_003705 [Amoeboaphelidium protococcarum]
MSLRSAIMDIESQQHPASDIYHHKSRFSLPTGHQDMVRSVSVSPERPGKRPTESYSAIQYFSRLKASIQRYDQVYMRGWLTPILLSVICCTVFCLSLFLSSISIVYRYQSIYPGNGVIAGVWMLILEYYRVQKSRQGVTVRMRKQLDRRSRLYQVVCISSMVITYFIYYAVSTDPLSSIIFSAIAFGEAGIIVGTMSYVTHKLQKSYRLTSRRVAFALFLTLGVAATISALVAAAYLSAGSQEPYAFSSYFGRWLLSDSLIKLIVIPFILSLDFSLVTIQNIRVYKWRILQVLVYCACTVCMQIFLPALLAQNALFQGRVNSDFAIYVSFPLVLVCGSLMGSFGSTLAILALTVSLVNQLGDPSIYYQGQRLLDIPSFRLIARLQIFIVIILLTTTAFNITQFEKNEALQQALESKLMAEQTNKMKTMFMSFLCHELRNPLHAITNIIEFMKEDSGIQQKEQLEEGLMQSANYMSRLINDVLDSGKFEAGKVTLESLPVDVKSITRHIIRPMEELVKKKSITFQTFIDDTLPDEVMLDSMRYQQIIQNLLSNAYKFTPVGGEISFSLKLMNEMSRDVDDLGTRVLSINVKDSGIGLSPEQLQHLFVPYTQASLSTTRQYGGTGLGLSIIQQIVDLMRGSINVDSSPGMGTSFTIDLPLAVESAVDVPDDAMLQQSENLQMQSQAAQWIQDDLKSYPAQIPVTLTNSHIVNDTPQPILEPSPQTAPSIITPPQPVRALVVDDAGINRMILQKQLQQLGVQDVVACENGLEACDQLKNAHFDIVFLDLHMPVMDGSEAIKVIRDQLHLGKDILPVVAVTGNHVTDTESASKFNLEAFNQIASKPFRKEDCRKILVQYNLISQGTV